MKILKKIATMNAKILLSLILLVAAHVYAQVDQSGYISIDCGVSVDYTDSITGIDYVPDTNFVESGVPGFIASFQTNSTVTQFVTLRSFPDGPRNCYTVRPSTAASTKFLIRARFMYGNYDKLNSVPSFDLYLGTNLWSKIQFVDAVTSVTKEIIVNITSVDTSVCLVNTRMGTPFISALELRPITVASTYAPIYGGLNLFLRLDLGSYRNRVIRYKDDTMDRAWLPFEWSDTMNYINTSLTVDATASNNYKVPSAVMQTAVTPKNISQPITFIWEPEDPTTEYYIYMHFTELEKLQPNQTREFDITLNGSLWYSAIRPSYLSTITIYSTNPKSFPRFIFQLTQTVNSTLPPIMNAIEIYEFNKLLQSPTGQDEVDAMNDIKTLYGIKKNWQGDPCAPRNYTWNGLQCNFSGYDPPQITYLNLSSSRLNGEIPSYIGDLINLQILDLSNNNLNGTVPEFLIGLSSLTVLNLAKNNLSGSVPSRLLDRSDERLLSLSVTDNVHIICASTSCIKSSSSSSRSSSSSSVVPIIGAIAGVAILTIIVGFAIWFCCKKKNQAALNNRNDQNKEASKLEPRNRQVTYHEVQTMTNNFQTVIGEGGFGTVYKGSFEGTDVAVKLLSPSSSQGYKEFHAEVKILLRVHHRNLTSLVGYCDDPDHKALIYEYMVNGDLASHLSARSANCLTWKERLRVGVDSAQGLEYLHNGCKPPIVHRDVKTTNILLNGTFQAKIADFGLSRVFSNEGSSQVSTVVAGTPGYLDPEYITSNRLHEKSDVFSFGVVLLEIITSARAIVIRNQEATHIAQWVSNMLDQEGDVRGMIDPRLRDDINVNSVWKAVEIAMACVSPTSAARPTMAEVVMELKECLWMETSRMNNSTTISRNMDDIDSGPFAR